MMIIGAGLAGMIASRVWPNAPILEAGPPRESHKALLRFRSDVVARLTGIDFRPVTVRKGIFMNGKFIEPSIQAANLYSRKVLDFLLDRSIWSLESVTRWIAPENFYDQMIDMNRGRIQWDSPVDWRAFPEPVVSTAPLFAPVSALLSEAAKGAEFRRAPIAVERFRVPDADVFQTVYFPTAMHSCYRASITGNLLIVEHAGDEAYGDYMEDVFAAFALPGSSLESLGKVSQSYGKIHPIEDWQRKNLVFRLSHEFNIFSLGRFATWRNILLDDVVGDTSVIQRLLKVDAPYTRKLAAI